MNEYEGIETGMAKRKGTGEEGARKRSKPGLAVSDSFLADRLQLKPIGFDPHHNLRHGIQVQ